jgi:hypothetical protein
MNCLSHSDLKKLSQKKFQYKSIPKLIIIILATLWSWPATAGSPNSGTDDDAARRRVTNNANRSAPQNVQPVQPVRSSNRDITNQPSSPPSRSFASPQHINTPLSTPSNSRGTIQFRSDSQPSSFTQSRSIITPANRKFEVPKFEIAADTPKSTDRSSDRSSDNSDQRSGRQDNSQKVQGKTQGNTPANTGQTNQNIRTGGTGSTGSGKDANQPQYSRSGTRPSISDINTRLIDQGLDKGKLPGGTGDKLDKGKLPGGTGDKLEKGKLPGGAIDKFDKNTSKINPATGTITPVSPTNPANVKLLDDVKKRLGADDRGGKRGPADLNLGKTLDTSPLKGPKGGIGPGLTTKQLPLMQPNTGNAKISRDDMLKSRFPDRLKSGELENVTKGDIAQKLKLSDQFKMMPQGDVARRLELQKHATGVVHVKDLHASDIHHLNNVVKLNSVTDYYADRPHFYHGLIGPAYAKNCFKFVYFGPTFFAGPCWYPSWNPWVAWSWHYHCHPIWDPRPIWSRPVIYDPYYDWAYWQTPVWVSLPEVQCGTWVDVQKPVFDVGQNDLQLLAVRFVDPGHPEEKLGPRYRVWFRNNGNQPVEMPFNVMLFAGNDDKLTADLPRSGVRVKAIEAGDTQSVDIRLPMEAATMWHDAEGKAAPFQVLHVMVDANREIDDMNPVNNGAAIQRDEVLAIDPAAFEVDPTSPAAGGEIILAGEGLGPQPGQMLVNVGGRELQAEVLGWYDLGVRFSVPQVEISESTPAEVIVVRGDGAATNPIKITLLPAQAGPALNPPPPPSPNPE